MRKTLSFRMLLCILVVLSLCGCGTTAGSPTVQATATPRATASSSQATATPGATANVTPSPGASQPISWLKMIDETTGWASTTTHRILHTTNGGEAWQDVTPPYPAGVSMEIPPASSFLNGRMAWVVVSEKQQLDGTFPTLVFGTSNGGQSWQEAMLPPDPLGVSQIQFVNAQDGWVLCDFGGSAMSSETVDLFRSTDGGQTWRLVASGRNDQPTGIGTIPLEGHKSGMGWASTTTGWISGTISTQNTVSLYRTQNGGMSWLAQSFPLPALQATIITEPPVFFGATEGLLPITFSAERSTSFAVYATHDGGATWGSSTLLSADGGIWDFLTMQQGWVLGTDGSTLNETSDGGEHWTTITPNENFKNISQLDFISEHEGWAISTPIADAPILLKTTDGGSTWVQVSQATSWKVVPSPSPGSFGTLNAVAAVSANNVWAVGDITTSNTQTLIEHWNGTGWLAVFSPNPGTTDNALNDVVAVSATDLWAVGSSQSGTSPGRTLIEHWNGTNWTVVPSPNGGTGGNVLIGIAALSATDLWAVGMSGIPSDFQTLIEHWNGTSWAVVSSPDMGTGGNELSSVVAVSATDLWAVGDAATSSGTQALIEHWNGTSWAVVSNPHVGSGGNSLKSVAAVSATDLWAVGMSGTPSDSQTLIEHWNGISWQGVSSPDPGATRNALNGVVAVSATDLWAVGFSQSNRNPGQTLIEQWNGTNWQVISSPDPGTANDALNGVVATSAPDLWAVGTDMANGSVQTLTVQYS